MKLTIFADLHLYGPKAEDITIKELIDYKNANENTFLLGDIIDFKNTRKKDMEKAKKDYIALKTVFGKDYIDGNHENNTHFSGIPQTFNKVIHLQDSRKLLLTHGHRIFWTAEKAERWEFKVPKGISNIKWHAMKLACDFDERFLRGKNDEIVHYLQAKKQRYVRAYADKHQADILICGHKHPDGTVRCLTGMLLCYICIKGKTEITL